MHRSAIIVALLSSVAQADLYKFNANNGSFHVVSNWLVFDEATASYQPAEERPNHDDRIIVPAGMTCSVVAYQETAAWTVDSIQVDADESAEGSLVIVPGATLVVENDDQNCGSSGSAPASTLYDHHHIDGTIAIVGAAGSAGSLVFGVSPHTIDGDGTIIGIDLDGQGQATIEIDDTKLTNAMNTQDGGIRGDLRIVNGFGDAVFRNEGLVAADHGELSLGGNLDLEDTGGAYWVALSQCSMLTFRHEEPNLKGVIGDVGGEPSILRFEASIHTSFAFAYYDCGAIEIASENSPVFQYCFYFTEACQNPADGGAFGCSNPFFIVTNKLYGPCYE